jgi:hypothetical protein
MKITDGTIEFSEREKVFLGLWRERFGRLPADWSADDILDASHSSTFHQVARFLERQMFSMELLTLIMDECAETKKPPTVYWLRKEYERRSGQVQHRAADCTRCKNTGVLLVAVWVDREGTHLITDETPRPCLAHANTVPCPCEHGAKHNREQDGSQMYDRAKLERMAKSSFSEPCDCDRFVAECNRLHEQCPESYVPPTQEPEEVQV